ncbi:carbonic anhydrase [Streptomyces sp. NPDC006798]|uniref:carbonic anhydrase n=1 Tax=Streptomyces sp. NPDC006798 TaxID=3155462 RepID=UPI0033C80F70
MAGTGLTLGGAGPAAAATPGGLPRGTRSTSGAQTLLAPTSPALAEAELMAGNGRWAGQTQTHPNETAARRNEVATTGQKPWAMIVSCIDSRVPPELIFDQGLGDLFVSRTAGPVIDEAVLASASYAASKSYVKLIVVLGHEGCGAVDYAIGREDGSPAYPPPHPVYLEWLYAHIRPIIPPAGTANRTELTIERNTKRVRDQLLGEADVAARVSAGSLNVIGARYDLNTWTVTKVV